MPLFHRDAVPASRHSFWGRGWPLALSLSVAVVAIGAVYEGVTAWTYGERMRNEPSAWYVVGTKDAGDGEDRWEEHWIVDGPFRSGFTCHESLNGLYGRCVRLLMAEADGMARHP